MAEFQESRPCVHCDGIMDRRHGTLPVARPSGPGPIGQLTLVAPSVVGTYYRCLKNGAHTVVVERDPILPPRRRN